VNAHQPKSSGSEDGRFRPTERSNGAAIAVISGGWISSSDVLKITSCAVAN